MSTKFSKQVKIQDSVAVYVLAARQMPQKNLRWWNADLCETALNFRADHILQGGAAPLPTYLPIYLPAYLPNYLPAYLPTYLPTCLPTYLTDGGMWEGRRHLREAALDLRAYNLLQGGASALDHLNAALRHRANMAHITQSRLDFGLGCKKSALKMLPFGTEADLREATLDFGADHLLQCGTSPLDHLTQCCRNAFLLREPAFGFEGKGGACRVRG